MTDQDTRIETQHLPERRRQRRRQGSFRRSMTLPPDADERSIGAERAHGVLTLTLPGSDAARQAERRIEIKGG